jgi:carboxypeptidase family protein
MNPEATRIAQRLGYNNDEIAEGRFTMRSTVIVCLLMLTLTVVFSQTPQRSWALHVERSPMVDDIQGLVYDQSSQPVAGAAVMVKNMRSGVEYGAFARDDGWYAIHKLATADSYELSVKLPQYESFDVKGVNIGWKLATRLDIVLRPK